MQHNSGSPNQRNEARKRNKRHPNQRGRIKLLLIIDDRILHIENSKGSTKKSC